MSKTPAPPSATSPPVPGDTLPAPAATREGEVPAEDLDLEEDIAPNLGGEDQMQDA